MLIPHSILVLKIKCFYHLKKVKHTIVAVWYNQPQSVLHKLCSQSLHFSGKVEEKKDTPHFGNKVQ